MERARSLPMAGALSMTLALGIAAEAFASSHREAPFITTRPKLDATDFYLFSSYEPGREGYVTMIANYFPLQDAYGGPNYFAMDPDAIYEIHVDNDGDAIEDITFLFDFDNGLRNDEQGLALTIGDQSVPVPLKHIGPLGTLDNSAVLNVNDTYFVGTTRGDRRGESPSWAVRADSATRLFMKPYDYAGQKSFTPDYESYLASLSGSGGAPIDVRFEQCPEGAQDGRVFVGQRRESFSVALGEIFDLVNFVPLADALPDDPARNDLADKNITSLAVEVHRDCLVGEGNGVIGAWTTASARREQMLVDDPSYRETLRQRGSFRQVSRLSTPLVNEVVIGLPDKNRFNGSEPKDDARFATYVTHPTLPAILDILFRDPLGAEGNIAPSNLPRQDLVAAFLTGFEGVNQLASVTPSEMLRLNTAIAPTPREAQSNLGVAAGDLAGFPNGRRPGDDVVDIALRVVMGALCHPIALDLDGSGTAGDAGDNLGLCAPSDAPAGNLPFTDGAPQNAGQFDDAFPYLTTPLPGSPIGAREDVAMMPGMPMMSGGGSSDGGGTSGGVMDDGDADGDGAADGGGIDDGMDDGMADADDCPVPTDTLTGRTVSSTELELSWDTPPGADAFVYEMFVDGVLVASTDASRFVLDGLDPGASYFVEVVAVDEDGARIDCIDPITLTAGS